MLRHDALKWPDARQDCAEHLAEVEHDLRRLDECRRAREFRYFLESLLPLALVWEAGVADGVVVWIWPSASSSPTSCS